MWGIKIILLGSIFQASWNKGLCAEGADPYCQSCSEEGCDYCVNSYVDSSGNCVEVAKGTVKYCESYTGPEECGDCMAGYDISPWGTCEPLPFSCAIGVKGEAGVSDQCLYCFNGYSLNSAGTGCTSEMCKVSDCNWCGNATVGCFWCRSGFVVAAENSTCIHAPTGLENCIKLAEGNLECSLCDEGYAIAANKTCVRSLLLDLDKSIGSLGCLLHVVMLSCFLFF